MLRILLEHRGLVSAIVAASVWTFGLYRAPFPAANDMLVVVAANAPHIHAVIRVAFGVLWFTSPYLVSSFALSFVYIFFLRPRAGIERISLPRYPDAADRSALFLVLGEIHKERKPTPIDQPRWLTIPRRALFTGIGIFGAVGSGKTTCCMYPFAEQLLAYRRDDHEQRVGGLVLEVKGDFCYRVREILRKHGREDDYIELSLACPYRYNPLYNDLEAYALAYGIASLLTNLSVVQGPVLAAAPSSSPVTGRSSPAAVCLASTDAPRTLAPAAARSLSGDSASEQLGGGAACARQTESKKQSTQKIHRLKTLQAASRIGPNRQKSTVSQQLNRQLTAAREFSGSPQLPF